MISSNIITPNTTQEPTMDHLIDFNYDNKLYQELLWSYLKNWQFVPTYEKNYEILLHRSSDNIYNGDLIVGIYILFALEPSLKYYYDVQNLIDHFSVLVKSNIYLEKLYSRWKLRNVIKYEVCPKDPLTSNPTILMTNNWPLDHDYNFLNNYFTLDPHNNDQLLNNDQNINNYNQSIHQENINQVLTNQALIWNNNTPNQIIIGPIIYQQTTTQRKPLSKETIWGAYGSGTQNVHDTVVTKSCLDIYKTVWGTTKKWTELLYWQFPD